uniref:Cytochrome c oxidase subunit 5A, mitochondrial n=1 Tax=Cynoglossus semilaevis TaxID=244447 RepID=A0A3P8VXI3_CYNSE
HLNAKLSHCGVITVTLNESRLDNFPRIFSEGMNTLIGYDLVPEPKIVESALRACRRLNDLASAVRILEAVKQKAGPYKEIYPYLIQELKPTLTELGISTPEELGIDRV